MLIEKICEEIVEVNVEVKDMEEAIRKAGDILLKNDVIEKESMNDIMDIITNLSQHIIVEDGIAMPNVKTRIGYKDLGIAIMTLKEPVTFDEENGKKVNLVFGLSASCTREHLKAVEELALIIDGNNIAEKSKSCETKAELIELIKKCYEENVKKSNDLE